MFALSWFHQHVPFPRHNPLYSHTAYCWDHVSLVDELTTIVSISKQEVASCWLQINILIVRGHQAGALLHRLGRKKGSKYVSSLQMTQYISFFPILFCNFFSPFLPSLFPSFLCSLLSLAIHSYVSLYADSIPGKSIIIAVSIGYFIAVYCVLVAWILLRVRVFKFIDSVIGLYVILVFFCLPKIAVNRVIYYEELTLLLANDNEWDSWKLSPTTMLSQFKPICDS